MTAIIASSTSNATASSPANKVTLTKPSGVASGDLLIIIAGNDNTQNVGGITDIVVPSGWTSLGNVGTTSTDVHLRVVYRIADGTEGATIDVGNSDFPSNVYDYVGFYLRITGHDSTTPINVTNIKTGSHVTAHSVLGVTTTVDDCLLLAGVILDSGLGTPFSYGSPFTHHDEQSAGAASARTSGCVGNATKATAGATGAVTVTGSASESSCHFYLAIAPGAGSGGWSSISKVGPVGEADLSKVTNAAKADIAKLQGVAV